MLVVAGVWWNGTRKMDFLTPPPEAKLAAVRARTEDENARQRPQEPVPDPVVKNEDQMAGTPATEEPLPAVNLGDLTVPPTLEGYSERALDGHAKLAELAGLLEKEGHFQRALLAWERSIDLAKPSPEETAISIAAIRRLKPTLPDWNTDESTAIPVILHAGTGPTLAGTLKPALEEVAHEIDLASAGLLKVSADLAIGKRMAAKGPIPVAIWLSGPGKETASTDVLSFTAAADEVLKDEIYRTVFQLISGHLKRGAQITPPAEPVEGETALQALQSNITRLSWREFGKSLNTTATPAVAPAAPAVPATPPR